MAILEGLSDLADSLIQSDGEADVGGMYLDDVRAEIRDFHFDLRMVGDGPFPCARRVDDTLAPLAMNRLDVDGFRGGRLPENTVLVSPDVAQTHFRNGLTAFLGSRFRSLSQENERRIILQMPNLGFFGTALGTAISAGFKIDVSASSNLRIHVSPTFRRNWRYFGSPTSPVHGVLIGGIYEFGADGGSYSSITADPATFDIPYATVSPVLNL